SPQGLHTAVVRADADARRRARSGEELAASRGTNDDHGRRHRGRCLAGPISLAMAGEERSRGRPAPPAAPPEPDLGPRPARVPDLLAGTSRSDDSHRWARRAHHTVRRLATENSPTLPRSIPRGRSAEPRRGVSHDLLADSSSPSDPRVDLWRPDRLFD